MQVTDAVAEELRGKEAARCRQALTPLGKRKASEGIPVKPHRHLHASARLHPSLPCSVLLQ